MARALAAAAIFVILLCGFLWPRPRPVPPTQGLKGLVALGRPIFCGGPRVREIALTFDDGPGPYTSLALRILHRAHDRATFFVVGRLLTLRASLVRRELRFGDVGDHTWTHLDLDLLPPSEVRQEIERTALAVREMTGRRVVFFRPPYGAHDPAVDAIVRRLGLLEILWSIDTRDSEGANHLQIAAAVDRARPGSIILMHENRGQTLRGLRWDHVLADLRARRLRAVSLTQLLTTDPPSRAQLAKGPRGCGAAHVSGAG